MPGHIERIEGKYAFVKLDDNQEFKVVSAELGKEMKVGDAIVMTIQPESEATLSQQELARTILNTLLTDERQNGTTTPKA